MDWLLNNLDWIIGAIITLLGIIFGTSIINKKMIQKNKENCNNYQIGEINVKKK